MIIFKTAAALNSYIQKAKEQGQSVGFVPTMGALHQGHLSLIRQSKINTALTVCSIFVNPTQFNNPEDFKHYPINREKDIELLIGQDCDVLFLPGLQEVYPVNHQKTQYDLGQIEVLLEGEHRPGHFQGVCEVVDRLLSIVSPDQLFMGQKDFQQCMVIERLLSFSGRSGKVQLNIGPTLREADGLAMSSRNTRLNVDQRRAAVIISESLFKIKDLFGTTSIEELEASAMAALINAGFAVDYVSISNPKTLMPVHDHEQPAIALIAASLGSIRLIDNMLLD
ncbi:MAG: pantoate--beta-alanine ligase [Flaviaesturariibacter sp.]|nr:pantoate--beta-alanine ligase [Flaviaesturariibacter sp.]